ncbi:MAG: HDOD domain-containing protein, partial [Gemmatimonadetes bacterium]|nr:HDOD domain-containing protein [Gemmatimonadota bacterium]
LLALDDFVDRPEYAPLIELADFIKVDFLDTSADERWRIARRYGSRVALLAEKVETLEDVEQGIEHGYQYFQGFFFCKPEIIARRDIPGFKLNYLRFFEELSRPELDFNRLEQIIEREVSLSVKLLRLLNSARLGYFGGVNTVWQALLVLGERTMQRWASMIAMTEMGEDKPRELVVTCLVRARFCELLGQAARLHDRDHDLFLVGMLSLIDALVGRPLIEVLDELAVSQEIREALIETDSPMAIIRALVVAHERGAWETVDRFAAQLSLSDVPIADLYREAVVWADDVFRTHAETTAPNSLYAR